MTAFRRRNPASVKMLNPALYQVIAVKRTSSYQATVRNNNSTINYFGSCETDFKTRCYNDTHSFRNRSKCKATQLSKFVWECKDVGSTPASIHCRSVWRASSYKHRNDHCKLCLAEKFAILTADPKTLNKETKLVNKCPRHNKFKLKNLKPWLLHCLRILLLPLDFLPNIQH